jgi:hypothetical protein
MSKSAQSRKQRSFSRKKKQTASSGGLASKSTPLPAVKPAKPNQKKNGSAWPGRIGLIAAGILSLAVAIYIGLFVKNQFGLTQGLFWGVLAGISIWVAFFGSFWFNRWLRRRQ